MYCETPCPITFPYLESARLIKMLPGKTKDGSALGKTCKVYLDNTNLMDALTHSNYNIENARETFFVNQLSQNSFRKVHDKDDFVIDEKYISEIEKKQNQKTNKRP